METGLNTGAHVSVCWRAQGAVGSLSHILVVPRPSLQLGPCAAVMLQRQ